MPDDQKRVCTITFEDPSGEQFEADVPVGLPLKQVAADFFSQQQWPDRDPYGRPTRAVVELVDPRNPHKTKRLNADLDVEANGIRAGATLRVFPEGIAGAMVNPHVRARALQIDYNELTALCEREPRIAIKANRSYAPDQYTVILDYPSFSEPPSGHGMPKVQNRHEVCIILGAGYPSEAPRVIWKTPIFHPNIAPPPQQGVCLGALGKAWKPGYGLARLVHMLVEIIQWRNYDTEQGPNGEPGGLNKDATRWALDERNWPHIEELGGYRPQGPIEELIAFLNRQSGPRLSFRKRHEDVEEEQDETT